MCDAVPGGGHTKDLRYESNDSREMEKGSMSQLLRVSVEVRPRYLRGHWAFSWVGEGGR